MENNDFFLLQLGETVNVDEVIDVVIKSCYAFGVIFSICEFGQQLSNRFDEIHSSIWEMDWFLFPIKNQKMLTVVLAIAQQPSRVVAFGNVAVTRETCKSVIFIHFLNDFLRIFFNSMQLPIELVLFQILNSGFSYFIIFRRFS